MAENAMTPAAAIFGVFAVLFTLCALLPVVTSAFFGYRTGERVAISIGAISGLVLLLSCGFFAWQEDKRLALFLLFTPGVPALCIFLGTLAGYIAIGSLGLAHEED
jgi:hypothetical protein